MKIRIVPIVSICLIFVCCAGQPEVEESYPEASEDVLRVKGRFLYNQNGDKVVIRGIEEFLDNSIDEIAKTGANAYRINYTTTSNAYRVDYGTNADRLDSVLYKAIVEHNLIVSVYSAHAEYIDSEWWSDPAVMAVLKKYESHLIFLAHGEGTYDGWYGFGPESTARWLREAKGIIRKIRSCGYACPIEIYSNTWGQNLGLLLDHGREIIDSDPQKNVILGCQLYTTNALVNVKPGISSFEQAVQRIVQSGLPIQLGACPFTDQDGKPRELTPADGWYRVWNETFENEISCFYWCWSGSPSWLPARDGLSRDGRYGHWTEYGEEICGKGQYALSKTARMNSYTIRNRPPTVSARIQNLVLSPAMRKINDYVNLKNIFTDYEDGTELLYSIGAVSRPELISVTIDGEDNLDVDIPEGSLGTCLIEIIAEDSGQKKKDCWFSVVIHHPTQGNLALFKKATASSSRNGMAVAYSNDGLSDTRWESDWKDDQWIAVDLGTEMLIDHVCLLWETAYGLKYEIRTSNDTTNWKTVYTENNGDGNADDLFFKAVSARFVRMHGIKRATPYGLSLWAFDIYSSGISEGAMLEKSLQDARRYYRGY